MNDSLILVVEDDAPVRNLIGVTLQTNGYTYSAASSGEEGVRMAATMAPRVILLDLGLPDMDGTEVIHRVRSWTDVPIIVISARSDDRDKIDALDAGADDYLTKPFSVEELLARLRATFRRLEKMDVEEQESAFVNGGLYIDYGGASVRVDGEEVHLTPTEYRLLCLLARNVGRVLTYTWITRQIWNSAGDRDVGTLRVNMATLRKKIEKDPVTPEYIHTHVGVGYKMVRVEKTVLYK